MSTINNTFWIYDPTILSPKNCKEYFSNQYSVEKILNMITVILVIISMFLLIRCNRYGLVTLFGIILIVIIYLVYQGNSKVKHFDNLPKDSKTESKTESKIKTRPNIVNPLKNITMKEIMNSENYDTCAVSGNDEETGKYVDDNRDYYKCSDETDFARFLYPKKKICKEDSMYCENYEDVRYNRNSSDIERTDNSEYSTDR